MRVFLSLVVFSLLLLQLLFSFLDQLLVLLVIELHCVFRTDPDFHQGLLVLSSFLVGKVDLQQICSVNRPMLLDFPLLSHQL